MLILTKCLSCPSVPPCFRWSPCSVSLHPSTTQGATWPWLTPCSPSKPEGAVLALTWHRVQRQRTHLSLPAEEAAALSHLLCQPAQSLRSCVAFAGFSRSHRGLKWPEGCSREHLVCSSLGWGRRNPSFLFREELRTAAARRGGVSPA